MSRRSLAPEEAWWKPGSAALRPNMLVPTNHRAAYIDEMTRTMSRGSRDVPVGDPRRRASGSGSGGVGGPRVPSHSASSGNSPQPVFPVDAGAELLPPSPHSSSDGGVAGGGAGGDDDGDGGGVGASFNYPFVAASMSQPGSADAAGLLPRRSESGHSSAHGVPLQAAFDSLASLGGGSGGDARRVSPQSLSSQPPTRDASPAAVLPVQQQQQQQQHLRAQLQALQQQVTQAESQAEADDLLSQMHALRGQLLVSQQQQQQQQQQPHASSSPEDALHHIEAQLSRAREREAAEAAPAAQGLPLRPSEARGASAAAASSSSRARSQQIEELLRSQAQAQQDAAVMQAQLQQLQQQLQAQAATQGSVDALHAQLQSLEAQVQDAAAPPPSHTKQRADSTPPKRVQRPAASATTADNSRMQQAVRILATTSADPPLHQQQQQQQPPPPSPFVTSPSTPLRMVAHSLAGYSGGVVGVNNRAVSPTRSPTSGGGGAAAASLFVSPPQKQQQQQQQPSHHVALSHASAALPALSPVSAPPARGGKAASRPASSFTAQLRPLRAGSGRAGGASKSASVSPEGSWRAGSGSGGGGSPRTRSGAAPHKSSMAKKVVSVAEPPVEKSATTRPLDKAADAAAAEKFVLRIGPKFKHWNVYFGPSVTAGVLATMPDGAEIDAAEEQDGWLRLASSNAWTPKSACGVGWVPAASAAAAAQPPSPLGSHHHHNTPFPTTLLAAAAPPQRTASPLKHDARALGASLFRGVPAPPQPSYRQPGGAAERVAPVRQEPARPPPLKDSYSQDVWGHKSAGGGVPTTPPTVPDDGAVHRGGWARPPPSSATPASSQAGTPRAAAAAASAAAPSAPQALFPSEAAAAAAAAPADAAAAASDSPLPSSPRHPEESGAIFDNASLDHEGLRHLPPPPPHQSLSRAKEAAMFFQHAPSEVPLPRAGTAGVDSSAISPKRKAKGARASSPWVGAALVPAASASASASAAPPSVAAFSDTRDVTPLRPQAPRGGGASKLPWPSQADSVPQLVRAYERERVASGHHTRDVEDNIHRSYMEKLQDNARRHVRGMDKPHVSPHAPSTRTARTPLDVESASAMAAAAAADGGGVGSSSSARDGKLSQLKRRYSDLQVGRERARERRVQFVDADGDAIAFSAEAGCLVVSVNGEELCRPRTVTADRTTASLDLDDGAATCPLPLSNNMALVERIAALVDTTPTCHNLHSWKAESWA